MDDLLDTALTAHGGLDRWNQVTSITVDASIGGAFWSFKNQGDALKQIRFEVETTRQRLTMDFIGLDKRSVFFDGHDFETPWHDLHLAYFTGEALGMYTELGSVVVIDAL